MRGAFAKKRAVWLITVAFVLLIETMAFSACARDVPDGGDTVRKVIVEGDVRGGFVRIENESDVTALDAKPGTRDFHGVTLTDFLAAAEPAGMPQDVYFMSEDGFTAKVSYADADEIYMIYNDEKGFCVIAPKHPVSAQAQEISRIVVVSDGSDVGLKVIKADGDSEVISKGHMLVSPLRQSLRFQGTSEMSGDGGVYSSSVYTKELSATLADLYADYAGEPFVVVTRTGDKFLTDGSGYFTIGERQFDYTEQSGELYEDVTEIQIR
ncbi:MAG: hypothetical protein LBQ21_02405 [Clostridiales Family XIII bacterium]|nr:hypothetical protein [Clostridiales Family XIII bacterium]